MKRNFFREEREEWLSLFFFATLRVLYALQGIRG